MTKTKTKEQLSLRSLIIEQFLGGVEVEPFLDERTSQLIDFFVDIIQAKTIKWYTPEKAAAFKAFDLKTYIDSYSIKDVKSNFNLTNSLVKRKLQMAKDERQYLKLSTTDEGDYF